MAAIALAASGFAALRDWTTALPGALLWNGKSWAWVASGQVGVVGDVAVCMDLQRMMLLRFTGVSGGVHWFWVAPAGYGAQWRALRRALFNRQATAAPVDPGRAGSPESGSAAR